jgi:hypothetical protein
MSAVLFNLVIDWVMRKTREDPPRGILWSLFLTLEDPDFADDLALLSETQQHIQEKTDRLQTYGKQVGLRISTKKTETTTLNVEMPALITVKDEDLRQTNKFTYLGSIITSEGGTKEDIQIRLGKARRVFKRDE